jgi:hypothetical protein
MNAQEDVKKFVDFVIKGFKHKYSLPSCSSAFNKLCVDNAHTLASFAPEIIDTGNLFLLTYIVVPNPATDWSTKQHYFLILDGVAALIEEVSDNK